MAQSQAQAQKQLAQYDTDIAVLKVEFKNLDTKFDTALEDVKADIKTNTDLIKEGNASTHKMLLDFNKSNQESHDLMASKIAGLEKWRWMLIGAGFVLGGLGYSGIEMMFMH
jgi:ABC-type transporter Mla subunit MlaD|tara:strand:- start:311 stop:646 length:336 start_codon:yes stop_codon:yes gene_type:complete